MIAQSLETRATERSDWRQAHAALSGLAKQRALADAEEGRCLLAALRSAAHVHLGFATFGEYVERLFGYGRRCIQEKLRVTEALEHLPALARALSQGALTWSAIREITRVAVPKTEPAWLDIAHGKTTRQLEELVAGKQPGDAPFTPSDPSARRHVLRFETTPDTYTLFRQAMAELRRRSGTSLDDDAVLLEMARCVLGGPTDEGRSSYQIALTICATCGVGRQDTSGDPVRVGAEIVEMANCDAQHIGYTDLRPANDAGSRPPATDANTTNKDAHVGAVARAKQAIPPALRRAVLRRDHHRCRVPGCRNATFVDIHHVRPRAEGGANHPDNLVTLCGAHHRALHRGNLVAKADANGVIEFQHADGAAYGYISSAKVFDQHPELPVALKHLGFRPSDIQRALERLAKDKELADATLDQCLRAALQILTPSNLHPA
jgi:hypothetical protein